jgi:hypothetical protein
MYLLDTDPQAEGLIIFASVLGIGLSLWIFHAIIKAAVKSGTKDLKNQLRLQNNLKINEMAKNGYPEEELRALKDRTLSEPNN